MSARKLVGAAQRAEGPRRSPMTDPGEQVRHIYRALTNGSQRQSKPVGALLAAPARTRPHRTGYRGAASYPLGRNVTRAESLGSLTPWNSGRAV